MPNENSGALATVRRFFVLCGGLLSIRLLRERRPWQLDSLGDRERRRVRCLSMAARFRLDTLLEESGLSQRELAARSGFSPTIVNRITQNLAKQVAVKTLDAIAGALSRELGRRIDPGDLIEGVTEKGKRGR